MNVIPTSCHCGGVQIQVPRAPADLTDCNCTICRRYATLWGYYSPREVTITGATDVYLRGERKIEFHRCEECGCVTHWAPADKTRDRMGVNFRLADPSVVASARIRRLDGFDTWKFLDE